jgi:hypothetical protein
MSDRRPSNLRLVETTLLVVIAAVLAAATINDVVRQVHVNHRLAADMRTWRAITGHNYVNLDVEEDLRHFTTRDVICGNTSPGAPGVRPQVCLIAIGPIRAGRRDVEGGFYLPPELADDAYHRYACFGSALRHHWCLLKNVPRGYPDAPLVGG